MEDLQLDQNSFVISVDDNRYDEFCHNFISAGFSNIPERITNSPVSDEFKQICTEDSWFRDTYVIMCNYNHYKTLKEAVKRDLPYVVIYEDDAYPCIDVKDRFEYYKSRLLSSDLTWGCLVFGRSGISSEKLNASPVIIKNDFIQAPYRIHGAHAYLIKNEYFKAALDRFSWWREIGSIDGAACDFSLCYPPLCTLCTKECHFIQRNNGVYRYPYFYNDNYTGRQLKSRTPPRGFI